MSLTHHLTTIQDLSHVSSEIRRIMHKKQSRVKNWRILSLWRELRKHKIKYYFLSRDQIVLEPIPFKRSALTIGIEKVKVPGASFTIDYYSIRHADSGNSMSLHSVSGQALIQKLVNFSYLHADEIINHATPKRYEPYQHCPRCGERNRMYASHCEACGAKLP